MAKKFDRRGFNNYVEQIRRETEIAEARAFAGEGEDCEYMHVLVNDGIPREIDMLSQKLVKMSKQYGGAVALDKTFTQRTGEFKKVAFIVRGSTISLVERAIAEASQGLGVQYEVREF